jgi:Condensation domain
MRRRLSPSERFDWLMAKDFPNIFAVTARVEGGCETALLRTALDDMSRRHPTLRSRVVHRLYPLTPLLSSENVPALPLRVVEGAGDQDWTGVVEDELQHPFRLGRGPLVRFVVLHRATGFDLVVVTSHLLADGTSYALLIGDLLERLARPNDPVTVQESPPGWDAFTARQDASTERSVTAGVGPAGRDLPAVCYRPGPPTGAFTVLNWAWDPDRAARLLARCRAEGTTVHAALSMAMLRAIARLDGGPRVRRLGSPISTRRHLADRYARSFGCYVGPSAMVAAEMDSPTDFWPAARKFGAELARRSDPATFLAASRILRVLHRLPGPLARLMIRKWINDEYDLWISNLTRLPIPVRYGERVLEAVHFAVNTGSARRRVLGVTSLDGRIDLTLASSHPELMRRAYHSAVGELAREVPWPHPRVGEPGRLEDQPDHRTGATTQSRSATTSWARSAQPCRADSRPAAARPPRADPASPPAT